MVEVAVVATVGVEAPVVVVEGVVAVVVVAAVDEGADWAMR